MDSNPIVSLSATQATPSPPIEASLQQQQQQEESPLKVSSSQSSSTSGSFPIRAPPSYDSDDVETDLKTDDNKINSNSSSSSSSSDDDISASEGFLSGEEDFDTASERPFVADPDEETLEMLMEEEDNASSFVEEEEEEVVDVVEPVVGSSNLSATKIAMPIAQLSSGDEDDEVVADEGMVTESDDNGGLSIVRVPRVEYPNMGFLEAEEGEENGSLLGRVSSGGGEVESGPESFGIASKHSKMTEVESSIENPKSGELGSEFRVPDAVKEASAEESLASKDDMLPENSEVVKVVNPAIEEIAELKQQGLQTNELDGVVEEEKNEVQPVEGGGADEADEVSALSEQSTESKFIEADDAGVVRNVEENRVSEIKGVEVSVEKKGSLVSGSDEASGVDEELVDSKRDEPNINITNAEELGDVEDDGFDQNIEPVVNPAIETKELEPHESKASVVKAEKDEEITMDQDSNGEKPIGLETEFESSGEVDGGSEIPTIASTAISAEPTQAQETKHLENGDARVSYQSDQLEEDGISCKPTCESADSSSIFDTEVREETKNEGSLLPDKGDDDDDGDDDDEGSFSDEDTDGLIFGSSEAAKQIMKELEQGSGTSSHSGAESSRGRSHGIDGQIVTDSDEEVDTDGEGGGKELFDSAALAALLKAATGGGGSDNGSITITSSDGSRLFSLERPAGLGSSLRSLRPAPKPNRPNIFTPDLTAVGESEDNLSEEEKKKLEKIQLTRVKFLRLVQRLGHSPEDSIAAQVLYRLTIAAGRQNSQAFSLETAKRTALQLETEGKDDLDFSLNILVLGKTGVGKSATINSIFGAEKTMIDAFGPATTAVKEVTGMIDGVKIRVFDTPGLRTSVMEQGYNQKILLSIKKLTKKCPPDIVLYVDRLDTQTRDLNDLPLLRSITSALGSSIWRSAIVTLTHAASAPPDGPSGSPLSYEVFVAQRTHVVQQSIGQAVGDLRLMNPSLMNPVSLVENHPSCRKNREGQRVLPNGQTWQPQLFMLCYSMKILSEATSLSKPQDPFDHKKLFGFRVRSPPLPYLLSSLLQSRPHPKLPADQGGENGDSDIDLGDLSDTDQEEDEDEYDQLPPFKPLRKAQIAKLSKEQRKAYFEEYDYRVKLLQKKQLKEELKRLKEMKKKGKDGGDDYGYIGDDVDQEDGSPAAVPVPLPDMVLPPSFDSDNPAYRYRFLEPTSQLLARPVLDTHGWDHDCGYDGVSLEENLAVAGRFPAGVAVQITKDKKEFNIHLDSSVSAKHGENGSSLTGFDIQTIGKQLAYILRGETKFRNLKKNKTTAGLSVTFLGENVATGLKVEDQITVGKRLVLVGSTGAVRSQGDMAYGANLEARLKEKDFPIGQDQSTLGLSLMKWRGDLALGANLQSQFSVGRNSKMAVRVGLNNKLSGQITVRTSSSEQLQIALVGLLPIAISIFRTIWPAPDLNFISFPTES